MIKLKKIHHLIRYFLLFAMVIFVFHIKAWFDAISLFLVGPAFYAAYYLKNFVLDTFSLKATTTGVNHYGFLFPALLLYYGFIGVFYKQLANERGPFRIISLVAISLFLGYIHLISGRSLLAYVTV